MHVSLSFSKGSNDNLDNISKDEFLIENESFIEDESLTEDDKIWLFWKVDKRH